MKNKLEELLTIQKKIELDKISVAKIQGKIDSLKEKLFKEMSECNSLAEIKEKVRQEEKKVELKEKEIEKETESIISEFKELDIG